jgi:hypothetical protein
MVLGRGVCQPEKRKVDSSILPLTTSFRLASSVLTSANGYRALSCPRPSSDYDCPYVTVVSLSLSHVDRTPRLHAPGSGPLRSELAALSGCGPWSPPLPPIGLTAADPIAGGQVSRADSRVRSPRTLTCARCPAVRSALDPDRRRITIWRQSGGGPMQLPRSCRRVPGPGQARPWVFPANSIGGMITRLEGRFAQRISLPVPR